MCICVLFTDFVKNTDKQWCMKKRTNVYYELEKLGRQEQRGVGSVTMKVSVLCAAEPYNLVGRLT